MAICCCCTRVQKDNGKNETAGIMINNLYGDGYFSIFCNKKNHIYGILSTNVLIKMDYAWNNFAH